MSVNTELSALLTKMGGTPLESDSNSDLIKKISNAYEGGGGGSGSGILVVHAVQSSGEHLFQLDKTAGEIEDAFIAGKNIYLTKTDVSGFPFNYPVTAIGAAEHPEYGYAFQVKFDMLYIANSRDEYPAGGDR